MCASYRGLVTSAAVLAGDVDLAAVGAVLAEPARAKVLLALVDGRTLAASVLAEEAGVAPSTASHHLSRLVDAGLIACTPRGRHRYFTLAGPQVAALIEAVARVAPHEPVRSLRQGTRAHAVRYARHCYDHLAGRLGVAVADAVSRTGEPTPGEPVARELTTEGAHRLCELGVTSAPCQIVRGCLDWTEQRPHLAGPIGRELLARLLELDWLARQPATRALSVTGTGRRQLPVRLGVSLP
jgi:DNA-binding transcriptional ArsR family regulator